MFQKGNIEQKSKLFTQSYCKQCQKNVCACNGEECAYAYKQYGMKRWVYGIIIIVISLGLIVPFFSETICTIWFPDVTLGLNTWNQFVSIILGIIATVLSIVSLIMGFKNYEDGLDLHEKNVQTLERISSISKDVNDVRANIERIATFTDSKNETPYIPSKPQWVDEPNTTV